MPRFSRRCGWSRFQEIRDYLSLAPANLSHHFQRPQAIFAADVVMGDEAHELVVDSGSEYVFRGKLLAELRSRHAGAAYVEDQNVRWGVADLDSLNAGQSFGY